MSQQIKAAPKIPSAIDEEGVLMRIGEVCGVAGSPPPGTGVPASPSRGEVSL